MNTTTIIFKELSIQIAMNGLSFAIKKSDSTKITLKAYHYDKIHTELELEEVFKDTIHSEPLLQQQYDKVSITHINNAITFVPDALFEENNLADYLKFAISLEKQQNIVYDSVDSIAAKAVYIPFAGVNNLLLDRFGDFEMKHHTVSLLRYFQSKNSVSSLKTCYLYFRKNSFDCYVLENNKLLFYNNFDYQNDADILYFLLFTFEQFKLDQEKNPIYYCGEMHEKTATITILAQYFKILTKLKSSLEVTSTTDFTAIQKVEPIL